MIAEEIAWIEQLFETLKADMAGHMREETARLHKCLDIAHDKLNTALSAISFIIEGNAAMAADHASVLADLKAFDADLDTKVDAAVSEFNSFVSTHEAVKDSLDDIAGIVAGLPAKLSKLDAIKAPVDSAPARAAAFTTPVTVSSDTPAGSVVLPVAADTPVAVGSTVTSPAVQDGTTVVASDPSSVTLSQPTTADHSEGDTVTVTAPPA